MDLTDHSGLRGFRSLTQKQWILFVVTFLAGLALLRLWYAAGMGIHPDEAYYWMWSRFPALSYYDQGPGASFYIRFFTLLFGETQFALKLAAILSASIVHFFVYLSAREMGLGQERSIMAMLLTVLIPGLFGGSLLIMHDSVLILFWSISHYCALRFIRRRETLSLLALFAAMGAGFLGKYTMVFFAGSLVVWLLFSMHWLLLLRQTRFWIALALGAMVSSPVLLWNIQNQWDGVDAIFNLRSAGGAFGSRGGTGLYLGGQMLAFSPLWYLLVWMVWLRLGMDYVSRIMSGIRERYGRGNRGIETANGTDSLPREYPARQGLDPDGFRLLVILSLVLPVFFLFLSRNRTIQSNWTFPSYLSMAILMAAFLPRSGGVSLWKRSATVRIAQLFFWAGLVVAIPLDIYALYSVPLVRQLHLKIDSEKIPGFKSAGYGEIIRNVNDMRHRMDPGARIIANRYQDASIASWYLPGHEYIPSMNIMQKNQYSYWPGLNKGDNAFLVFINDNACQNSNSMVFFQPVLGYIFEKVQEFPMEREVVEGRVVKTYQVWYLQNYRRPWDTMLEEYMVHQAILDLMPNLDGGMLRGEGTRRTAYGQHMNAFMGKMHLMQTGAEGCSGL